MSKTIVIGACGQIGTELVLALRQRHGNQNVSCGKDLIYP
jgi:nucleoside-diphosphate-sugar epimerase